MPVRILTPPTICVAMFTYSAETKLDIPTLTVPVRVDRMIMGILIK